MRTIPNAEFEVTKSEPWIKDAPFESHLYNGISLILPVYERTLIKYVCMVGFPKTGHVNEEATRLIRQEQVRI